MYERAAAPLGPQRMGSLLLGAFGVLAPILAAGLIRFATTFLYGLSATDPVTHLATTFLLAAVAAVAAYVPARRALGLDPVRPLLQG